MIVNPRLEFIIVTLFAFSFILPADKSPMVCKEYDKDNTWSTKYNIFFHTLLNMSIFNSSIIALENSYYTKA